MIDCKFEQLSCFLSSWSRPGGVVRAGADKRLVVVREEKPRPTVQDTVNTGHFSHIALPWSVAWSGLLGHLKLTSNYLCLKRQGFKIEKKQINIVMCQYNHHNTTIYCLIHL